MLRPPKILIVDDDPLIVEQLEALLGRHYALVSVSSGDEAGTVARVVRPDVMLIDSTLAGPNGYEVCKAFRQSRDLGCAKLIVMVDTAEVASRILAYECGADDVLVRPFHPDELLAKVRVFLRVRHVEELERFKQDILSLLNHETRTPLTAVFSSLQLMAMSPRNRDASEQELLDGAMAGCERLRSLLERASLLQELRSGTVAMELAPVALASLISGVVTNLTEAAESRGLRIRVQGADGLWVLADQGHLARALYAVLHNAVRYSPHGGRVTIGADSKGGLVTVSVTDQGPGIPRSRRDGLFDWFVAGDMKHHTGGQGLGLAICHEVVHQHGGFVDLITAEGKGTTILLSLLEAAATDTKPVLPVDEGTCNSMT